MNKFLQSFFSAIVLFFLAQSVRAQAFTATYDFANVTASSGRTDPSPVPIVSGLTFSSFMAVAPAPPPVTLSPNPNAGGRFSFTGWPLGATNNSDVFTGSINLAEYYEVTITPQLNIELSLATLSFTLQRSATGIRQYAVRSSIDGFTSNLPATIDPATTNLKVVDGNVFQVSDLSSVAENGSKLTLSGITALQGTTSPVTFRFYGWSAEAGGGTFSIDNVSFSGSSIPVTGSPVLTLSTAAINFLPVNVNTSSAASSFTIQGENLLAPVTVSTTAPFSVSDMENGTYTTSLEIPAADVVTPKTVYVKFSPAATGPFNGVLNFVSGVATKNISLTGEGIDPTNLVFNFDNCASGGNPGSGFVSYSVTGVQRWACSNFGNNTTKGVDVNGFSGGVAQENEDWLISPPLQIGSLSLPILSFYSRGEFAGPSLQLLVSTEYDGISDPNSVTWTDLQANFPLLTNTWTFTDGINLSAYKSAPKVYIAFKYTSSAELGAARWTIDDVSVSDRSKLLSVSPGGLNFGEISAGNNSAAQSISVQAIGYGNITINAPAGYELSANNTAFSASIQLDATTAETGTTIYARFSPPSKALKWEGKIKFIGTGLDSNYLTLTGTSYPKAETFDAGAYNLSFFGSNPTNNPTPEKITTQINNIATVFQHLNLDVVGIEEMSNDDALAVLISKLPGYASVVSNRWSYSFDPPDPAFPPQKVGFIYNTTTMQLVESRVMFEGLYDSVRTGTSHRLDNYPTGTPSSFWASGRLPFMATFNVTIGGVTRLIRLIDIHAKSASDGESYRRRLYDVQLLKDSLDAYYRDDNIILVGDYNDRVIGSINVGSISPYKIFVDDNANYTALTLPLDQAGRVSFISGTALIDHIIISNEVNTGFIPMSADIEDPRTYVSGYNATTASDHLPIFSRFLLNEVLPVTLIHFTAQPKGKAVLINWSTAMEVNNSHFLVERSADGKNFTAIASVPGAGSNNGTASYQYIDSIPLPGTNYYRLKQVDIDGRTKLSDVVVVKLGISANNSIHIYPNPVGNKMLFLNTGSASTSFGAQVLAMDGKVLLQANGNITEVGQKINRQLSKLKPGNYIFKLSSATEQQSVRFMKQ